MFTEKKLESETIAEFSYLLLVPKDSPLAAKDDVTLTELHDYIEITHADPYVPSLPLIDVKKAELSEHVDKRIFVFERASQFELLQSDPRTFMWVSPVPKSLLDCYGLVIKRCSANTKVYKDVLIYRKDYRLTDMDKQFITDVTIAKRECFAEKVY